MNHHTNHHRHYNNKSKPSNPHPHNNNNAPAISQIDVEGTLRAAISRYHSAQQNNSGNDVRKHPPSSHIVAFSPGKQWYDKLPLHERRQIDVGIDALLYAGCMAAAKRTFDTVVRQEMANSHDHGGGDVDGESDFAAGHGDGGNDHDEGCGMTPPPPPPQQQQQQSVHAGGNNGKLQHHYPPPHQQYHNLNSSKKPFDANDGGWNGHHHRGGGGSVGGTGGGGRGAMTMGGGKCAAAKP